MSQHDASYQQLFSSPHMMRCRLFGEAQMLRTTSPPKNNLATLLFRLEYAKACD